MSKQMVGRCVALGSAAALLLSVTCAAGAAMAASSVRQATQVGGAADPTASTGASCTTPNHAYASLATRMARDIDSRLTGRESTVGLEVRDSKTGIVCYYHADSHFIAASAIKVTILSALLLKAQEEHRGLTSYEKNQAWLMITQSDNDAATVLWNEVGISGMQHFLNLAKMTQTKLSYSWGLTQLTAHDETLLLTMLTAVNPVLDQSSRVYARYLMAHVIASQRWGVPAGAPDDVIVHVKNGWLPYPGSIWEINSIGMFTNKHRAYTMAVLTYNNPSMDYGIDTIERVAEIMHHDLN